MKDDSLTQTGLIEPTDRADLDRVLRAAVALTEVVAPGQVLSYYLVGSHAAGAAVPGSDLDLAILLKPGVSSPRAAALRSVLRHLGQASPVPVDPIVYPAYPLANWVARCPGAWRLLYGVDVRPRMPSPSPTCLLRAQMRRSFRNVCKLFRVHPPVRLPLEAPSPGDPWLGLAWGVARYPDGSEGPGTQGLVSVVLGVAQVAVVRRGGPWLAKGSESLVAAYKTSVGNQWAEMINTVSQNCRARWGYRIPGEPGDQAQLRAACERAPAFVTDFAIEYKGFCEAAGDGRHAAEVEPASG